MNQTTFAETLRHAIIGTLAEFHRAVPDESPYAFAIIVGQCGGYLGYAVATEEGLRRAAAEYYAKGYRSQEAQWEEFDHQERLAAWLRWANPDDGWHYGDFAGVYGIDDELARLSQDQAFGQDAEDLEEFCTEVLASLWSDSAWLLNHPDVKIILGVTTGEDSRDFLRTATRANDFETVRQLWAEHRLSEELSGKIPAPRPNPA